MLKIPEDVAKGLRSGNVRLFVGSGVLAAAGMLGSTSRPWGGIRMGLRDRLGQDPLTGHLFTF